MVRADLLSIIPQFLDAPERGLTRRVGKGATVVAWLFFTEHEIAYYLGSRPLGRLATVGRDCVAHVVPVGCRYDSALDTIDIGGHALGRTRKFRNIQRQPRALRSCSTTSHRSTPGGPRGTEIRARAEALG